MIPNKDLQKILKQVSDKLGLPEETVTVAYRSFWEHIKFRVSELPPLYSLNEDDFKELRTSFNIPGIGKYHTDWKKIQAIKRNYERNKYKESDPSNE